jgi:hypothetical protein
MGEDAINQVLGNVYGEADCRRFDASVGDYLDGESRPEISEHAGQCRSCGLVLSDLKQLISASTALPDEDPPPRLWANLRICLMNEGLIRPQEGFWGRWSSRLDFLRRPAPVAVLGGLAVLSVVLVLPSSGSDSDSLAFLPSSSSTAQLASSAGADVNRNLQQTVQELQAIYQSRAASFQPALSAAYEQGLRSLDVSIKECQESVRREPANSLARDYLLSAYEQKAEVLQSALEFDGR